MQQCFGHLLSPTVPFVIFPAPKLMLWSLLAQEGSRGNFPKISAGFSPVPFCTWDSLDPQHQLSSLGITKGCWSKRNAVSYKDLLLISPEYATYTQKRFALVAQPWQILVLWKQKGVVPEDPFVFKLCYADSQNFKRTEQTNKQQKSNLCLLILQCKMPYTGHKGWQLGPWNL